MSRYTLKASLRTIVLMVALLFSNNLLAQPNISFGDIDGYFYNWNYRDDDPDIPGNESEFTFELTVSGETGSITNYEVNWDGTGTTSYPNLPRSHVYDQGEFPLTIKITYGGGSTHTYNYTVYNTKPTCSIEIDDGLGGQEGCIPHTIKFKLTGYEDNPPNTLYSWNFGDETEQIIWTQDEAINDGHFINHTYEETSCPGKHFIASAAPVVSGGTGEIIIGAEGLYSPIIVSTPPDPPRFDFVGQYQLIDAANGMTGCVNNTYSLIAETNSGSSGYFCEESEPTWDVFKQDGGWIAATEGVDYNMAVVEDSLSQFSFRVEGEYKLRLTDQNGCSGSDPDSYQYESGSIHIFDINSSASTDYTPKEACLEESGTIVSFTTAPEEEAEAEGTFAWDVYRRIDADSLSQASLGIDYEFENSVNTDRSPSFRFLKPGYFEVYVYKENICGIAVLHFPVEIYDHPEVAVLNPVNMCMGETYTPQGSFTSNGEGTFYGMDSHGITAYEWTFDYNGTITTSNLRNPAGIPLPDLDTLKVSLKAYNDCGWSEVSEITFNVRGNPVANFSHPTAEACQDLPIDYNAVAIADAGQYIWRFGDGTSTTGESVDHTFNSPGNKSDTLIAETVYGCCDTMVKTLQVNLPATANAGLDDVICNQDTYQLNGSAENHSGVVWTSEGDGNFDNPALLTATYTPGDNDKTNEQVDLVLTAIGNSPCDNVTDTVSLDILPPPEITLGTTNPKICEDDGIYQVQGTVVTNSSTFSWSSDSGGLFDNANTENPQYFPPEDFTGTIELTLTAEPFGTGSCSNETATVVLVVEPTPKNVNAGENVSLCQDETYTLSGSVQANTYTGVTWVGGVGSFDNSSLLAPTYTPADGETGNVTLSMTALPYIPCGQATDAMVINYIPFAKAHAGPDNEICIDSDFEIPVGTGAAHAVSSDSSLWQTTGDGTFDDSTKISTIYRPGPNDKANGTVTLSLTAYPKAECVASDTDELVLEITPLPVVDAGVNGTICQRDPFDITTASSNGNLVEWTSSSPDGYFDDVNSLTTTYHPGPEEIGEITLTLTAYKNSCAPVTDFITLNITESPISDAGPDAIICEDGSFTVNEASVEHQSSILWTTNGEGTISDETTLTPTYTTKAGETGDIYLVMSAWGNGTCLGKISMDSIKISIVPHPTITAGDDGEVCSNEAYQMNVGEEAGQVWANSWSTIEYFTAGDGSFISQDGLNVTYVPETNDKGKDIEITIRANSINPPCPAEFAEDKMILAITPEPLVSAGDNSKICEKEDFAVTTSTATEYLSLLWSTSEGGNFDFPDQLQPTYTPALGETGLVELTLTGQGNGSCQPARHTMQLDIVPLPQVTAGPDVTICEGKDFVVASAEASSYSSVLWETIDGTGVFEDNSIINARYIPSEADLLKGEVSLKVTIQSVSPCSTSVSDVMKLSFTPPPIVEAGKRDTVCQETGTYTVLKKSPGYEFGSDTLNVSLLEWTTDGKGTVLNENTLSPTYQFAAGEHGLIKLFLTAYGNANCDQVQDTFLLTILPSPVPDFEFGLLCMNNQVDFTDASSGVGFNLSKWEWDFGDGNTSEDINPQHQYDAVQTYTTSLKVTNFWGCVAQTVKPIDVQPLPVIQYTHDAVVAVSRDVEFTNNTSNGNNYLWDFGDGETSDLESPVHVYQETGEYQVKLRAESAYGCIDSAFTNIEVIGKPTAGFAKTGDGCSPLWITFTSTSQGKHLSYHWDFETGETSTNSSPDSVLFPQGILSDTTYTVTLRVSNVAGESEFQDEVKVLPLPVPDFEILPNSYGCSPIVRDIYNLSQGKPQHYVFDFGDGTPMHEYDKPNVERPFSHQFITGDEKSIYSVRLTASNMCGTTEIEKKVTVFPNTAVAVFKPNVIQGCTPLTVEFENLSVGAGNYLESNWVFEEGTPPIIDTEGSSVTHTFTKGGEYKVMLIVRDTCAIDTAYTNITAHEPAHMGFEVLARKYCQDEAIQFQLHEETSKKYVQLNWDFGDGTSSQELNPEYSYPSPGTYRATLSGTDIEHSCPGSDQKELVVGEKPLASFTMSDSIGCEPFPVNFTNQSEVSEFYHWDFKDGATSSQKDCQNTFIAGDYDVMLIAETFDGCLDTAYHQIISRPKPIAGFEIDSSASCDVPFQINVTNTTQDKETNTYVWNFGEETSSNQIDPEPVIFTEHGFYDICLYTFNQFNCSDTVCKDLKIYHRPEAGFEISELSNCENDIISFKDTSLFRKFTYWDFGDGKTTNGAEVEHAYSLAGQYSLKFKVVGEWQCADSIYLPKHIAVYPLPKAEFTYANTNAPPEGIELEDDTVLPNNGSVQFTNQSEVGGLFDWINNNWLIYNWDFRDQSYSDQENPLHRFTNNGLFNVKLKTTSAYGCNDSISHPIDVNLMSGLYIPNAFAPGNANEEVSRFIPKGIGLHEYRIEIYDTWGNMVWESEELIEGRPAESWDGNFKGRLLPQGTYVWRARAVFLNGSVWEGMKISNKYYNRGTVTLVR